MKNIHFIESLQREKESTKQLVLTSVFLAIGVDSLTAGLLSQLGLDLQGSLSIVVGIILISLSITYFLFYGISKLTREAKYEGFIIYDMETKGIIPVNRYRISEDMANYLNAAFIENQALKILWNKDSINKFQILKGKAGDQAKAITTDSGALFIELLEYCIIEQLSLHLSSYFNNSGLKEIVELSRSDIPDILLKNRFLKLFSEDMEDRALFVQDFEKDEPLLNGKTVVAYHPSGAVFRYFNLVLPKKSKVKRVSKNQILLETSMFAISIKCLFGGFNISLPAEFEMNYVGITNPMRFSTYQFNVDISIKFKYSSFFLPSKWSYYNWADDFTKRIDEYLSKETFFNHIEWETASTILHCQNLSLTKKL